MERKNSPPAINLIDTTHIMRRYEAALARRQKWDGLLEDAYFFAFPNRPASTLNSRPFNNSFHAEVFEDTAATALRERAAQLHGDIFPPFQEWLGLRPQKTKETDQAFNGFLENARTTFNAAIDGGSNFHTEIDLALQDALISTGCLTISAGTDKEPLRFEAVPISQLAPEEGADGRLSTAFRTRDVPCRLIPELWPLAELPATFFDSLNNAPDKPIKVIEAFIGDPITDQQGAEGCAYSVYLEGLPTDAKSPDQRSCIFTYHYKVSPIILFRFAKCAGESLGRGPVIDVLPTIKSANKVAELILKNAALAISGVYMAEDDGVLNIENIHLTPGTVIPIAQGSAGLRPLQATASFDVSGITLSHMQDIIRRNIMGPALPPVDSGRRTATEFELRAAELQRIQTPLTLRIMSELIAPLSRRIMHILTLPAMAASDYYIQPWEGDSRYEIDPTGPILRIDKRSDALSQLQSMATMKQIAPDAYALAINEEKLVTHLARNLGIPDEYIHDGQEISAPKQQIDKQQRDKPQMEQAERPPPPPSLDLESLNSPAMEGLL